MSWITGVRARLEQVLKRGAAEERMDEEIRFHIEMETEKNLRAGMSPEEARRRAVLAFGGVEAHREELREGRRVPLLEELWRDLRYAARSLRKSPGFTAAAVLTLGLGVGANAAVFSLVSASLLRPLPFPDAERLVVLQQTHFAPGREPRPFRWWSYPQFEALRSRLSTTSHLAAYWASDVNLSGGGAEPVQVWMEMVSAPYFPGLAVRPALGRAFLPQEDSVPGAHPAAVLSHEMWERRFGADPQIIGRELLLNGVSLTVVGVMPEGFRGLTGEAEVWVPQAMGPLVHSPDLLVEDQYFLGIVGRLRPGVSLEQARAEMASVGASAAAEVRAAGGAEEWEGAWGAGLERLEDARRDPVTARAQLVLAGAALFVLLIAVVNLSGLLLARSTARARETVVRAALGATRLRLVRHGLSEGGLLGLLGAALGMVLVVWSVDLLVAFAPEHLGGARPRLSVAGLASFAEPRVDWRVIAFAAGVALGAGMLGGLIPALRATRGDLTRSLKTGARGSSVGVGTLRRPSLLSAAAILQVACALVLLVGAALLLQGFQRLSSREPGFDPDPVVTFRISPPGGEYSGDAAAALLERILGRVEAVPGVRSATVGYAPFGGSASTSLRIVGRSVSDELPWVGRHYAGPNHFRTMGIPLLRGRALSSEDRAGRPRVAVINETAARRFWPGEDPIGKRVLLGAAESPDSATEIVGVVGDVLYAPPGGEVRPDFYTSYLQFARASTMVMVRAEGDPRAVVPALRRAVADVDPNLPIHGVRTMRERAAEALAAERFATLALGAFAGLGLLLAALGVYGVMAYSVAQRRREIGIRLALGSTPREVQRFIIGQGLTLAAAGLVIGAAATLMLTRALPALIAGIGSADPAVFATVVPLLFLVALLACYLPARAATRVDPVESIAAD
jgi:putative ABC transport system permease protein